MNLARMFPKLSEAIRAPVNSQIVWKLPAGIEVLLFSSALSSWAAKYGAHIQIRSWLGVDLRNKATCTFVEVIVRRSGRELKKRGRKRK